MQRKSEGIQLELGHSGWGGKRAGAGRKPDPCHVTLKVRDDVPSFRTVKLVRELERSWAKACDRGAFRLAHYSIQANHVHLIVEAKDADGLGRGMKAFGARLARAVNRAFARRGPVLRDRYHHVVLKTPTQGRNALRYVLLNTRRHMKRAGGPVRIDLARAAPARPAFTVMGTARQPSLHATQAVHAPRQRLLPAPREARPLETLRSPACKPTGTRRAPVSAARQYSHRRR